MLGTNQKKKPSILGTCIVPIVGLVVFIAGCYLLCSGIFLLNGGQLSFAAPAAPTEIPVEIPTAVPTDTPVSYFFQPQAASFSFHAARYPLTFTNDRS